MPIIRTILLSLAFFFVPCDIFAAPTQTIDYQQHYQGKWCDEVLKAVRGKQKDAVSIETLQLHDRGVMTQPYLASRLAVLPEYYRWTYHNLPNPFYCSEPQMKGNFASHLASKERIDLGAPASRKRVDLDIHSLCRNLSYFGLAGYDGFFNTQ